MNDGDEDCSVVVVFCSQCSNIDQDNLQLARVKSANQINPIYQYAAEWHFWFDYNRQMSTESTKTKKQMIDKQNVTTGAWKEKTVKMKMKNAI